MKSGSNFVYHLCSYLWFAMTNYLDESKSHPATRDHFVTANWFWTQLLEQNRTMRHRRQRERVEDLISLFLGTGTAKFNIEAICRQTTSFLALKIAQRYLRTPRVPSHCMSVSGSTLCTFNPTRDEPFMFSFFYG